MYTRGERLFLVFEHIDLSLLTSVGNDRRIGLRFGIYIWVWDDLGIEWSSGLPSVTILCISENGYCS
jgi:hypothetical protein